MSRFIRSVLMLGMAAIATIVLFGTSGLIAQAYAPDRNRLQSYPVGVTFSVNSSADVDSRNSELTLREAIKIARGDLATSSGNCITDAEMARVVFGGSWGGTTDCNYLTSGGGSGSADVIQFDAGTNVVTVTSALPIVDCGDIIRSDAFDTLRRVTIDGTSAGGGTNGLTLSCSGESDIKIGYVTIRNFNGSGIYAQGVQTATLVGLDLHGNGGSGLYLTYSGSKNPRGNQIGTTNSYDRNYIYSNGQYGVEIEGNTGVDTGALNNHIENNLIGVGTGGNVDLGNTFNGVYLRNAWNNNIGGNVAKRNTISGNNNDGIKIEGDSYASNVVSYNYIGTNMTGTVAIGNGVSGISLIGGTGYNLIGSASGGGNVIAGSQYGIFVNSNDNTIYGNFIGTNATSASGLGNSVAGISVNGGANSNTIGLTSAGWANVISGNTSASGIDIKDSGTSNNTVEGNKIGTNVAGTAALANSIGVQIRTGAMTNTIGTPNTKFSNLISGNSAQGILIDGASTGNNMVYANYIGTNITGTAAIPNQNGVAIRNGSDLNTIGDAGGGNLISGNSNDGVNISGSGTNANYVHSNTIGLNASATAKIPNQSSGVAILSGAANNRVGAPTGKGNIIAGNNSAGVFIADSGTTNNYVYANYIGTNAAGSSGLGNSGDGVYIAGAANYNWIGSTPPLGNIISGNAGWGVAISTNGNAVDDNLIGTNSAGTAAVGNLAGGVRLSGGAQGNFIGDPGHGNVISGNAQDGLQIKDSGTSQNYVFSNTIGLNATATAKLPNNWSGVAILNGASSNHIGAAGGGRGNIIAGNGGGVYIADVGTQSNAVINNAIGTNWASASGLGNASQGVGIYYGAAGNFIGSVSPGEGNIISGNGGPGVDIGHSGTNGNKVFANTIGTNAAGTTALHNSIGVRIWDGASSNTIGTILPDGNNLISGNASEGVGVYDSNTLSNTIAGNTIGLNQAGSAKLPNDNNGVLVQLAASTVISTNWISGNKAAGVAIDGARDSRIESNIIGANANGSAALGNHGGVSIIHSALRTTVGSTDPDIGQNLISGNTGDGVSVNSSFTTTIENNLIGLNLSGLSAISNTGNGIGVYFADNTQIHPNAVSGNQYVSGNGQHGIYIVNSTNNWIGPNNYIGFAMNYNPIGNGWAGVMLSGTVNSRVDANIGNNGHEGVGVIGLAANHNMIDPAVDKNNLGLPIDLNDDGFTPNDPGDADTGPNGLLNYPVMTAYSGNTITGTVCANCTVLIYQALGNPTANGGGALWSGNATTADASGVWAKTLLYGLLPVSVTLQTCEGGCFSDFSNTSEFSPAGVPPRLVYLPLVLKNN